MRGVYRTPWNEMLKDVGATGKSGERSVAGLLGRERA